MLCVAQTVVVAIAALAEHHVAAAALVLAEAAALGWLGRTPDHAASVGRILLRRLPQPAPHIPAILAAGAVLAALATTVPAIGLPLALILLGVLMVAVRPLPLHQALGIAAAQNGLVLAALAVNLSNWHLALAVLPWLPALAFAALWLGTARARTAWLRAPRAAAWIDVALSTTVLLLAGTLPWHLGAGAPFWRLDPRAVNIILLLATLTTAATWARRHVTSIWGSQLAILAGTVLAVAASAPLVSWLGMTLATAGAVANALPERAEAWRRLCLASTGLGLALFGSIALHEAAPPLAASACIMLGYGTLAMLAPELTVAAVALILRTHGASTDDLLLVAGLAALLVAALGLGTGATRRRIPVRAAPSTPRVMAGRPPCDGRKILPVAWPAQAGHPRLYRTNRGKVVGGRPSPAMTRAERSPALTRGKRAPAMTRGERSPVLTRGKRSPAMTRGSAGHNARSAALHPGPGRACPGRRGSLRLRSWHRRGQPRRPAAAQLPRPDAVRPAAGAPGWPGPARSDRRTGRRTAVRAVPEPRADPGRHRGSLPVAAAAARRRAGGHRLAPSGAASRRAPPASLARLDTACPAADRRLRHAGAVAHLVPAGRAMTALDLIRAAAAEPCRPWPRHILAHPDWQSMATALAHDPANLLGLWADTLQVHALLRDGQRRPVPPRSPWSPAATPHSPQPAPPLHWFERMIRDLWGHAAEGGRDAPPLAATTAAGRSPTRCRRAPACPAAPWSRRNSPPWTSRS